MGVEEANRDRLIIILDDDDDEMMMIMLTIGLHGQVETEFIHLHLHFKAGGGGAHHQAGTKPRGGHPAPQVL